jgi:hypothetical protein
MSEHETARRLQIRDTLKRLPADFTATLDPHLDPAVLSQMGIDTKMCHQNAEMEPNTSYFNPMTQESLDSLHHRPHLRVAF